MKKILLMGRSECGKTSLSQALSGSSIFYHKTQYINHHTSIIDTPGEYVENYMISTAIALYSYEADIVGFLLSSTEKYSLYPPGISTVCNRPVIGIVTKIDDPAGNPLQAQNWLELAGCTKIFHTSSYTGEGIWQILECLREPGDLLPWSSKEEMLRSWSVESNKYGTIAR